MGSRHRFFQYTWGILLILAIIFLLGQLDFFFKPFQKFLAVLFLPVVLSGFFYYLGRPLIRWGEGFHFSRTVIILVFFLLGVGAMVGLGVWAGAFIARQFNQLVLDLPGLITAGRNQMEGLLHAPNLAALWNSRMGQQLTGEIQKILPYLTGRVLGAIEAVTGFAAVLVLVPFILFYFLKDDEQFSEGFLKLFPRIYRKDIRGMMIEADRVVAVYIIGQVILASVLGVVLYIGYLILGLHYPLILALFALVAAFIPMFGPIIGVVPAVLVGLAQNPWLALEIVILAVGVHLLESHLLAPQLIGKRLAIHPLTIIFIFLVAAALFGFVGVLVAVPVYAVAKIIFKGVIKIVKSKV